ncbi:MAG: hypothetical protein V4557_09035 [Bacteroidota bacterium]
MADKSFEQQVKKELSGLRMKPADSVWSGVEAALHQERKRRWLVWLFLLAGIAGASFWGYYYFKQDTKETANTPTKIQSLPKDEPKKITETKETTPGISQIQTQKNTEPAIKMVTVPTEQTGNRPGVKQDVISAKNLPVKNKTDRIVLVDQNKRSADVVKSKQESQITDVPKSQSALITEKTTDNNQVNADKKDIEKVTAATQQVAPGKDSIPVLARDNEKVIETISVTPAVSGDASPVASTIVKSKKNKWQWNIAVDAGSSGLRDAFKLPNPGGRLASITAPATPGNGNPAPLLNVEPAVKDAFSFGIHLQATKQLGKKHRFGLSAGYSLFQTSMNVGRRVDSALFFNNASAAYSPGMYSSSFYYTNTDSTAYMNKYHFLRLGADLYTPFRLFKKVAFQWQLGAGINILAATNGLHYDPVTTKLFSNNALYAKTQFYISTGIDLSIGKVPFLYIGPHWQYSFTNLTSKPGGNQHLVLSSVKVSFVLPKKKK